MKHLLTVPSKLNTTRVDEGPARMATLSGCTDRLTDGAVDIKPRRRSKRDVMIVRFVISCGEAFLIDEADEGVASVTGNTTG